MLALHENMLEWFFYTKFLKISSFSRIYVTTKLNSINENWNNSTDLN